MATTIEIPSFNWAAFYYAEILEALLEFKRIHAPEHTDESPQDPLIQALRAYACVGHLNSTNTDVVANESTLPTAHLVETVRNMLRLIDYELASASPGSADIVLKLTSPLIASSEVINTNSQVSTKRTATEPAVVFELLAALTVARSDLGYLTKVFAYDESADTYTDYTTEANSAPGDDFTPWAAPAAKDCLYIGHSGVMWNQLGVALDTAAAGITGIWEYHNGDFLDGKPDTVERVGATLRFTVNGILGTADRVGTLVRVQLDETGRYEEVESQWGDIGAGDVNYIVTSNLLGQTVTEADGRTTVDYTVGRIWKELSDVTDGTSDLTVAGDVSFTLPENLTEKWEAGDINNEEIVWMRYRIISVSGPTAPVIDRLRIDEGDQYVKGLATQGQTQVDANLGTADGVTASQEFTSSKDGFIDSSDTLTVASVAWTRVANFIQSRPTDRHYMVVLGENVRATFKFGNGSSGAIPSGQVAAVYRYGIEANGLVGASTIVVDKSGLGFVTSLWNPRPAVGWQVAQGSTEESLEQAKVLGPASLRSTQEVALGPPDVETMTLNYEDANGSKPFVRSSVIEEGFGPKTMENVVVAAGGGVATAGQLDDLDEFFNGDKFASPPVRKRLVGNHELTSTNYSQKVVDIEATVYDAVSVNAIEDSLAALLQPETRRTDGVTFEWQFGGDVFLSRMNHEIHAADDSVTRIEGLKINGVAANQALGERELPVAGTIVIVAGS